MSPEARELLALLREHPERFVVAEPGPVTDDILAVSRSALLEAMGSGVGADGLSVLFDELEDNNEIGGIEESMFGVMLVYMTPAPPRAPYRDWSSELKDAEADELATVANSVKEDARVSVAFHPATRPETLTLLARDLVARVRWAVSMNTNTPANVLADLAADPDLSVRAGVAGNKQTPPTLLEALADAPTQLEDLTTGHPGTASTTVVSARKWRAIEEILWRVALNPSTPAEALERLVRTEVSDKVRQAVWDNAATPASLLATAGPQGLPTDLVEALDELNERLMRKLPAAGLREAIRRAAISDAAFCLAQPAANYAWARSTVVAVMAFRSGAEVLVRIRRWLYRGSMVKPSCWKELRAFDRGVAAWKLKRWARADDVWRIPLDIASAYPEYVGPGVWYELYEPPTYGRRR